MKPQRMKQLIKIVRYWIFRRPEEIRGYIGESRFIRDIYKVSDNQTN